MEIEGKCWTRHTVTAGGGGGVANEISLTGAAGPYDVLIKLNLYNYCCQEVPLCALRTFHATQYTV